MGLLSMNAEQLRYKMKHLDSLCPNRSVTNDDEFYELYSKLRDLIEDTESLFGGLSVERRVLSIQNKIDTLFCKIRG